MSLFWPCFWLALIAFAIPGFSRLLPVLERIATSLEALVELARRNQR